jgi:hypothetical protein
MKTTGERCVLIPLMPLTRISPSSDADQCLTQSDSGRMRR